VAPDITIAGQTAPGDGVTVYGERVAFSDNTIVRHLRFHGSITMPRGGCTVIIDNLKNAIFDHVSIAWGRWDNLHIKGASDVTLQYCLIAEGIDPQMFGALIERPQNITIHHCLWSNNQSRNPKGKAGLQYYNNVVYNWKVSGFVGGHSAADHYQDMISNYFIAGPDSSDRFIAMFTATDHVYHRDNYADLNKDGKLNGRVVTDADFIAATATLLPAPTHTAPVPVTLDPAREAVEKVLAGAGASLKRDIVDARQIAQARTLGRWGKIIRSESDAGGQPEMRSGAALPDSDRDGIPDAWEKAHGLDPKNPDDGRQIRSDGYSNLEYYINSIPEMPATSVR
jgi:pectate lyase